MTGDISFINDVQISGKLILIWKSHFLSAGVYAVE